MFDNRISFKLGYHIKLKIVLFEHTYYGLNLKKLKPKTENKNVSHYTSLALMNENREMLLIRI